MSFAEVSNIRWSYASILILIFSAAATLFYLEPVVNAAQTPIAREPCKGKHFLDLVNTVFG
jgi:hypothetical protein